MDLGFLSAGVSPSLEEFLGMLRKYPLCAICSDNFVGCCAVKMTANKDSLVEDFQWPMDNWELFSKASDLFWKNLEVQEWVAGHAHAERGVHCQNADCTQGDRVYPALDLKDASAPRRSSEEQEEV